MATHTFGREGSQPDVAKTTIYAGPPRVSGLETVFSSLGKNSPLAAEQLLGYLAAGHPAGDAIRYARHLIF